MVGALKRVHVPQVKSGCLLSQRMEVSQHKPTVRFSDSQAGSKEGMGRKLCGHPQSFDIDSLSLEVFHRQCLSQVPVSSCVGRGAVASL